MRAALLLVLVACSSSPHAMPDAATAPGDGMAADTARPADAALTGCASTFGSELTSAFGRLDGTILAVLEPGNMTCAMPNSTHVVLEVSMHGAAYRMVVNVLSTSSDPHVWLNELDAPLAGGAWQEGWHPGVQLDYVTTLHTTKAAFTQADEATAVARLQAELVAGAHVSVFATSSGGATASSAHLIHRNATDADGAIVISPETGPHYLLTAFPEQTF